MNHMEKENLKNEKIEMFLENVKKGLEQYFTGCVFNICSTVKNNGQEQLGIKMQEPGRGISPVICMEKEFQEFKAGRLFQDILSDVFRKFEDIGEEDFAYDKFMDFGWAKDGIFFHLINAKENEEALQKMPHRRWMDLAVVYSLLVAQDCEWTASMPVSEEMMKLWGVNEKILYAYAQKNTPRLFQGYCRPMGETISEMLENSAPETSEEIPMYFAGNSRQCLGSAVILYDGFLESFAERIEESFYILPSSIHEMIFLPVSVDICKEGLLFMVREINKMQVPPEEVLSDNIYLFHADTWEVEMIENASGSEYVSGKEKIVSGAFWDGM